MLFVFRKYPIYIVLSIIIFGNLIYPQPSFSEILSVKGERVNLRKGPGSKYQVKWEYGSGFPLNVIRRQGKWIKVEDFEGDQGWIHKSLLEKSKHVIVNSNRNSNQTINIRSGPSINYAVVGKAHYGVVFQLNDRSSGWAQVEHESGLTGWIKDTLLWGF